MGSFTKIYVRSYHPEDKLTLSWDVGYRNVEIFDGKRLVKGWEASRQFIKGTSFEDEKLGKIHLKFSDSKPILLELKVNGKKYKPTKKGKETVDTTGQASVFWGLMTFTLILMFICLAFFRGMLLSPISLVTNGILLGIATIYFFTAFLMNRKFFGAFFIGYSYMALHLIFILSLLVASGGGRFWFIGLIYFLIRLGIFLYLTLSIRKVAYAIRTKNTPEENNLLDEKL